MMFGHFGTENVGIKHAVKVLVIRRLQGMLWLVEKGDMLRHRHASCGGLVLSCNTNMLVRVCLLFT